MSQRERTLAIIILGIVGLVLLDWLVIGPTRTYFQDQGERTTALEEKLDRAQVFIDNADLIQSRWDGLTAAGLARSEGDLRIAVQQNLSVWAQEANFRLSTLVSGRTMKSGEDFEEMQFIASGSGDLAATLGLLERVHTSPFPLQLLELDITSRSETDDLLAVRATFSTLRQSSPAAASSNGGAS